MNWRPARENSGHQEAQDKALMILENLESQQKACLLFPVGSAFGTSHRSTRIRQVLEHRLVNALRVDEGSHEICRRARPWRKAVRRSLGELAGWLTGEGVKRSMWLESMRQ